MTDSPSPEAVERSLQEALFARAEDMAPGDGAAWDPYRPRSEVVSLGPETEAQRGPGWRTLAAAVAAIALPVAGGAFLLADRAEAPEPPAHPACAPRSTTTTTVDPGPPTTAEPTTTTVASPVTIQSVPTSTAPADPGLVELVPVATTTTMAPTTTTDPCAPEDECDGLPWVAFIGDDPTQVEVGESGLLEVWAVDAGAQGPTANPQTEIVTTVSGGRGVEVTIGEVLFVAQGVEIPESELLALAATVEPRTPGSLSYTPPCDAVPPTTIP